MEEGADTDEEQCRVEQVTASELPKSNLVLRPFEPEVHYELAVLRSLNQAESRVTQAFRELLEERLAPLLNS